MLKGAGIFFVVDHDDRYHWIRLRSRRDLQMIQVKADVLADISLLQTNFTYNPAYTTPFWQKYSIICPTNKT